MPILLTIDVEDYFQVENLRPFFPLHTWDSCDLRIEESTRRLLDLFARHNVRATFFVLGWIAARCPGLVREILSRGHEVASHGYHHQVTHELSRKDLRDDLYRSKAVLEDLTGEPVKGYRAPKFSLNQTVLEELGELGYRYDSSWNGISSLPVIMNSVLSPQSISSDGISSPASIHSVLSPQSSSSTPRFTVSEIPVSNLRVGGRVVPMGGGGYFRFWPASFLEKGVARILRSEGRYVFYLHPWEIDADQPKVKEVTGIRRFKHYLNLSKTYERLDHLLSRFKDYPFLTCTQYLEQALNTSNGND